MKAKKQTKPAETRGETAVRIATAAVLKAARAAAKELGADTTGPLGRLRLAVFDLQRVTRAAIPSDQYLDRLLVAITYDGDTATILAHAGEASEEVESMETVFVNDLDVKGVPREPGLHVWEGEVCRTESIINDVGALVQPAFADWLGSWRRATPEEAQRYAAGEPVWGSADA